MCFSTNLTLLCVLSVLALTTGGVYCRLPADDTETRVDVTIFAPAAFLSARPGTLHFNLHRDTAMEVEGDFHFQAFGES